MLLSVREKSIIMNFAIVPFSVTHKRFVPKKYKFTHRFFWFKLDLNNLDKWPSCFVGINRASLYSFYDSDHIHMGKKTAKDNYISFAKEHGLSCKVHNITLYTSLRFLGYVFNPVSFVLIEDVEGRKHGIIEIGNTFGEQKPFYVSPSCFEKEDFTFTTTKFFYISPFIRHDNQMTFVFKKENENISIFINDESKTESILKVWFSAKECKASTQKLLMETLLVPFVTFKAITLIHFHAAVLWLKGIKYFKKNEFKELQQGVFNAKSRNAKNYK